MAENKTQSSYPQFIMWVKEGGVFRPAEVKMPENYLGYRLEGNVEVGGQEISPDRLDLVSSVYLGPVNILEEVGDGNIIQKDEFQRKREFRHGTVQGIVGLAKEVAEEWRVPYFGVNIVQTAKDRTWKFTLKDLLRDNAVDSRIYSKTNLFDNPKQFIELSKPKEPIEFVLHPTAQLYVPRE